MLWSVVSGVHDDYYVDVLDFKTQIQYALNLMRNTSPQCLRCKAYGNRENDMKCTKCQVSKVNRVGELSKFSELFLGPERGPEIDKDEKNKFGGFNGW